MRHRLHMLLSVGLLIVSALALGLWVLSASGVDETLARLDAAGPGCSIRTSEGRLALFVPPPDTSDGDRRVRSMIERMDNAHVAWTETSRSLPPEDPRSHALAGVFAVSDWHLSGYGDLAEPGRSPDADRPLLDALTDPTRFLAAHLMLSWRYDGRHAFVPGVENGRYYVHHAGVRIDLGERPPVSVVPDGGVVPADPALLVPLRRYWANRLAVPVASVPLWAVGVVTAAWPVSERVRAARRRAERRRRRSGGLCPDCGYDLRGSTDRCPECGCVASR